MCKSGTTMKLLAFCAILIFVPSIHGEVQHCKLSEVEWWRSNQEWKSMVSACTLKMRDQVQKELNASLTYLAMGSHFLQDTINRPGFAKFFLDSASEERQHALKLIQYLLMRGELSTEAEYEKLINFASLKPNKVMWTTAVEALRDALGLEVTVTNSIREIIMTCEQPGEQDKNFNDYHLVDWLTGDFLEEQYQGQRDLAGKISTLSKMVKERGDLGEFLYDKTLL